MDDDFSVWLGKEITRRGITQAYLARNAGVSRTSISDILSGKQKAGYDVCVAISKALSIAPENILRAAGLLPPMPEPTQQEADLLYLFRELSSAEKADLLRYIRIRLAMSE